MSIRNLFYFSRSERRGIFCLAAILVFLIFANVAADALVSRRELAEARAITDESIRAALYGSPATDSDDYSYDNDYQGNNYGNNKKDSSTHRSNNHGRDSYDNYHGTRQDYGRNYGKSSTTRGSDRSGYDNGKGSGAYGSSAYQGRSDGYDTDYEKRPDSPMKSAKIEGMRGSGGSPSPYSNNYGEPIGREAYGKEKIASAYVSDKSGERYQGGQWRRKEMPADLMIELNSADTTELMQLRGIGSVLSKRIVKFRDKMGGFYSKEQLAEVYGLSEETLAVIMPHVWADSAKIKPLKVNDLGISELKAHPYISYYMARALKDLQASSPTGRLSSFDEIKGHKDWRNADPRAIRYLSFE